MDPKFLRMAPFAALLLLSLALALGLCSHDNTQEQDARMVGTQIVGFDVPTLMDPRLRLSPGSWRGRVAVLNIFASWCESCVVEHEALMRLAKTGKVAIYGLAWKDKAVNVSPWLTAHGNPYQLIGIDEYGSATIPLALTGVPETFVIDKNNVIRYHKGSPLTDDDVNTILALVEKLDER